MGQLSPFLRKAAGGYLHWCPGCKQGHYIAVDEPLDNGARWSFDGDVNSPTFNPSINIVGQCHYFIHAGIIKFCGDSKHELAGKTVPLPSLPDHLRGE